MNEKLKTLYELQVIDSEIDGAKKTRAALDNGAARRQKIGIIRREHAAADKLFRDAAKEMQDCDLNLKSVEAKAKSCNEKLYAGKVTNAKELANIEQEIAMLGRQKDKLEERIIELMDSIEEHKTKLDSVKDLLEKHESEYNTFITAQRKKATVLAAKIKDLTAKREEVLPRIDKSLLATYDSMRSRLSGISVSKVVNDTCSVCNTYLLKNIIMALEEDTDIQICENCSRILYLEK